MCNQIEHPRPEKFDVLCVSGIKLLLDAVGKNPHRLDLAIIVIIHPGFVNVSLNDWEVVQKRSTAHGHKIFIVDFRTVAELHISFCNREGPKVFPSMLSI